MLLMAPTLRTVRHKLLLMVLVANLFTLLIAGSALLYHNLIDHQEKAAATLSTLAGTLGQASAAALEFDDVKIANENLAQLHANSGIVAAALYTAKGTLFASYIYDPAYTTEIPSVPLSDRFLFEKGSLNIFKVIDTPQGKVGTVYLKEHYDISLWLADYLIILSLVFLISLILGLVISSRLQRWISGPIQAVSGVARQVMEQRNYNLRAVKSTEDEIGQLADAFNGMLETLEHEISERCSAEQAVRLLNAQLEQRVADRTAELEVANQRLVLRTNEAETANRAKADFLANMSHEIRTPMNAILGLAYLLNQRELDVESGDLVKKIRNAGRSLQSIINDILDFSKIEAGHLEIEHVPFRLADVLDNLAGIMSANAGNKELELVIAPPPDIAGQLLGDALRLEQVLINLTGNAIKFTEKGVVAISIELLSRSNDLVTLRFAVKDTGIGLPVEKQNQIFTAFTQADVSTTRRYGGTGLGLAICKHLVTKMGGEIGVNSELGKGCEFWFTIPFTAQSLAELAPPEMARLDVLIVDDSEIARETLSLTAKSVGWNTTQAESGTKALEKLNVLMEKENKNPFNIFLIDWKMPGMDGLQVARTIRNNYQDNTTPIVLMVTAFSRDELLQQPDIVNVDGILNKPVTSSSLYNTVADILRRRGLHNNARIQAASEHKEARILGIRVLIVDDSEINREVAMRILTAEGGIVYLSNDGKEAVDWLCKNPDSVDIVLMDVQMPIMDGYEATIQLRKMPQFTQLPIIALTAGAFKAQQEAARNAGMNAFVAKPFSVEELLSTIQGLTHSHYNEKPGTISNAELKIYKTDKNLPGLDAEKGLSIWKDVDVYSKYLRRFIDEYNNCDEIFFGYFSNNEVSSAKSLAHKIKGVAGNLALPQVAESAARLEHTNSDNWKQLLSEFKETLNTTLKSIELFSPTIEKSYAINSPILNTEKIMPMLKELIIALDKDTPDEPAQIINKLDNLLPSDALSSVKEYLDNFDFRRAEIEVKKLIEQYQI